MSIKNVKKLISGSSDLFYNLHYENCDLSGVKNRKTDTLAPPLLRTISGVTFFKRILKHLFNDMVENKISFTVYWDISQDFRFILTQKIRKTE